MIPYEDLCAALATWRAGRGLANGPSATPPPPLATPMPPADKTVVAPAPAAFAAGTIETAPADDGPTALHVVPTERSGELVVDSMDVIDEDLL
ncbi:MAG TPA: hypothetical protein VKE22_07215 [Haliangiales bacterium]|nr:hypothetical protein [Haliangiales bacterium]